MPAISVTFATRGYGGTWSVKPITSAIAAGELLLNIVGQSDTVARPIVWVNSECIAGDATGLWVQGGQLYSRSSTTTYSGGGASTLFYDFLLPPTNGNTLLSVSYSVNGAGAPVGTWQLYAATQTAPGFVLTNVKTPITDVLYTSSTTGSYFFTKSYDFLPKNPIYLRFGLAGTASMQSFTFNIGGNDN